MGALKTNFKNDILSESMNGKRRYKETQNSDGSISLDDVSSYDQVGSDFGAAELNEVVQTLYGFKNNAIVFSADGKTITEAHDLGTTTTTFNDDGSITSVLTDASGNKTTKRTTFNDDGSISIEVE